jgi:hypothetical protein
LLATCAIDLSNDERVSELKKLTVEDIGMPSNVLQSAEKGRSSEG